MKIELFGFVSSVAIPFLYKDKYSFYIVEK